MTYAAALRGEIRAEGGLLAGALADVDGWTMALGPAQLASEGPRAAAAPGEYGLAVEAVAEGYRLHYSAGDVLLPGDPDLALLAGDRLYALGLSRLAVLGDLAAVAELADLIALCAQSHAEEDPERAAAAWEAGAAAVGWGETPEHERAKGLARASDASAPEALRAAARHARTKVAPPR